MDRMNRTPGSVRRPVMAGGRFDIVELQLAEQLELDLAEAARPLPGVKASRPGLGQLLGPDAQG